MKELGPEPWKATSARDCRVRRLPWFPSRHSLSLETIAHTPGTWASCLSCSGGIRTLPASWSCPQTALSVIRHRRQGCGRKEAGFPEDRPTTVSPAAGFRPGEERLLKSQSCPATWWLLERQEPPASGSLWVCVPECQRGSHRQPCGGQGSRLTASERPRVWVQAVPAGTEPCLGPRTLRQPLKHQHAHSPGPL